MARRSERDQRLTTRDAAKILGLSSDGVRYLERIGRLPAEFTQSRQRLFRLSDVNRLARQREADRTRDDAA